jgi:predicted unusual protein kinase regulating ubiquinone biosynthesis (AarF/ABC1/UbiB family)
MYQFKFRVPPYYTLLVRSLSVLEGIALASDPKYKVGGWAIACLCCERVNSGVLTGNKQAFVSDSLQVVKGGWVSASLWCVSGE